jgi:hypothetical protein
MRDDTVNDRNHSPQLSAGAVDLRSDLEKLG